MLKKNMKKRILIMLLWGFPLCFCGGVEFPEHSFAPSGNEHFIVDDYGSEIVGSAERPFSGNWKEDLEDAARMNPVIVFGHNINNDYDSDWVSYVDIEYWEYFLEHYPAYKDDVKDYFDKHPDTPNNPFRLSLIDDIGAIIGMILVGIAYGVFAYRVRRQ